MSITDGQVYLSLSLFELGVPPVVDVGTSVSRVGGKAQRAPYRAVKCDLTRAYAQFEELHACARVGACMDEDTSKTIAHGRRIGGVTELHLVYNRPLAGAVYAPVSQRLLPLDDTWRRTPADRPWPTKRVPEVIGGDTSTVRAVIREYVFVSLFRGCAESLASENASRLAAMQRADQNIDALLGDCNGRCHRIRQSGIDEELVDVIAGFEVLAK